jgi:translation initiation factor IF-1
MPPPKRKQNFRPGGGNRSGSRNFNSGGRGSAMRTREPEEVDPEAAIELEGVVTSVLAGTMFRVKLKNEHEVLAHISGKMRKRFIRLVVGDQVKLEMSPYDPDKGRIVYRL